VSLWLKRLVEQFLGRKVLNEPVLRGEVNDIVRGIENDVEEGAQTSTCVVPRRYFLRADRSET
jgi:hypothetical protein